MIQNLWSKIQSLFDDKIKKRPISNSIEETPTKKLKLDTYNNEIMNEDANKLKNDFTYLTRNVTVRKNLKDSNDDGYRFNNDSSNNADKNLSFFQDKISDNYSFIGSQNFRYKSTPKKLVDQKLFGSKIKIAEKQNFKTNLTTYEYFRLKEKAAYEALVNKYSDGLKLNNLTFINSLNKDKYPEIIELDKDDSNHSLRNNLPVTNDPSITSSLQNINNTTNHISAVDNVYQLTNLHRDPLKQSYSGSICNSAIVSKKPEPSAIKFSNISITKNYAADRSQYSKSYNLEQIERRLKQTSKQLDEVFLNSKNKIESQYIRDPICNVYETIVTDQPGYDEAKQEKDVEIIDLDNRTLRCKEIEAFTDALAKSPYANHQYLSDLSRPALNVDVREAIVKGETEINFYKNLRHYDEEKIINKMNRILKISKTIPPPIDESILYIDESDEDELDVIVEDIKDNFTSLTEEQEKKVDEVFRKGASDKVAVEAFRLQITFKDLSTLADLNWLNDEIINFYMNLIVARDNNRVYAFNTFFYPKIASEGQKSVRRWTKNIDIFSFKIILIPIHLGVHWCLAVINFENKQICYYDSMGGNNQNCLNALQAYLQDEHKDKKGSVFSFKDWQKIIVKNIPHQENGSDCGMFACKFAEYISRGAEINFTQRQMPYFRKRMVLEIIEKRLWS